jgi:hypothetical protein
MLPINHLNHQPPGGIAMPADVLAAPMQRATALSGLSRSGIYRAAAEGKIRLLKAGRTTLVDMASVRDFLAALPAAQIGRAA